MNTSRAPLSTASDPRAPRPLTPATRPVQDGGMGGKLDQRGLGLIEIVLVLVVLAVAGALLYRYLGSTARTVEKLQEERTLGQARLAADQATLGAIRSVLLTHRAQHGQWPADKPTVIGLLPSPPRFQCAGNDVEYDPGSGTLRLLIDDATHC